MPSTDTIGTGRSLMNPYALRSLRACFPGTPLIVDAGIGAPSHAAEAMEIGFDGVLLNTAVAKARDAAAMAAAFAKAIEAGRLAYRAGLMPAPRYGLPLNAGRRPCLPRCSARRRDFYPIVPDASWVARLARAGVKLNPIADERRGAERHCPGHPGGACGIARPWLGSRRQRLLAGGHRVGRTGFVHLGRSGVETADASAIRRAGLRDGISTHSHEELSAPCAKIRITSRSAPSMKQRSR